MDIKNQTDIFDMGITDEYAAKRKREEEARLKEQEENRKKWEEAKKEATNGANNGDKKPEPQTSKATTNKKDEFEVDDETVIRYHAQDIPITDYFSTEEIREGLPRKRKDEVKFEKINAEDVRKRLEKDFAELIKNLCQVVYNKKKNMIIPVPTAGKKGADTHTKKESSSYDEGLSFIQKKIPYTILSDFIVMAKYYGDTYGTELCADIYYSSTNGEFILDIPEQNASRYEVERTEDPAVTAMKIVEGDLEKIMEIHSHHSMAANPSAQDNRTERAPYLYAIIGRTDELFPQITVRTFDLKSQEHIPLNPADVFESPYNSVTKQYNLSVVEVS